VLAEQVLYCLSHIHHPLCFALIFRVQSPFLPRIDLDCDLPTHAYLLKWSLANFLLGLSSNLNPPDLCFQVIGITGVHCHVQLKKNFFFFFLKFTKYEGLEFGGFDFLGEKKSYISFKSGSS
jgi:hypothetical protein